MTAAAWLGVIGPFAAGCAAAAALGVGTRGLRIALGLGWGIGAGSLGYFARLVVAGPPGPNTLAVEGVGWLALAGVGLVAARRRAVAPTAEADPPPGPIGGAAGALLGAACVGSALVGLARFAVRAAASPHGTWDAWETWNLRARAIARGGVHWAEAFGPAFASSHPDYPPMLPMAVARGWAIAGGETTAVPIAIALACAAATVGVLVAALAALRGRDAGRLGGLVLLGTPFFAHSAAMQFADVPLAGFYLATLVAFRLADARPGGDARLAALAGMFAGLAAWTKNEGIVFVGAAVASRAAVGLIGRPGGWRPVARELAAFAAGLTPGLLALAWFKLGYAPPNDLVVGQTRADWSAKLLDPARHALILAAFARQAVGLGEGASIVLLGYLILMGRSPRKSAAIAPALTITLTLVAYYFVYLSSPRHLPWHLQWSADRLFLQLWPAAILTFFLAAAAPSEANTRRASAEPGRSGPS